MLDSSPASLLHVAIDLICPPCRMPPRALHPVFCVLGGAITFSAGQGMAQPVCEHAFSKIFKYQAAKVSASSSAGHAIPIIRSPIHTPIPRTTASESGPHFQVFVSMVALLIRVK